MILTERHQIPSTPEMVRLCGLSRDLYNRCNYLMRQAFFKKEKMPNDSILWKHFKRDPLFLSFDNANLACQVLRQCLSDWSAFFKTIKSFKQDKSKFKRCPRPPKPKEKLNQIVFYNQTIKGGRSKVAKNYPTITPTNNLFSIPSTRDYKTVVLRPTTFGFIVEVAYESDPLPKSQAPGTLCIDLGVNNLCAATSDQLERSILVNGRIVKSINQQYNKNRTKEAARKRHNRIENYFHHVSKMIVDLCLKNNIGQIIIGKNSGWKTGTRLGKKTNQTFQSIPFYKLIQKIKYKAELVGIEVIETEEAYTSQASFLDRDPLPQYQKGVKHTFSGKRISRGLYRSKSGRIINADLNGSANIGRKVIQNVRFADQLNRSLAARPRLVNPLKTLCV